MNMYKVEVKNMFKDFIIWTVVMIGIVSLFMAMFPSMSNSGMSEIVKAKISAIPEGMRKSFGITQMVDFSDLLQYFAYCAQYILIGSCIYAGILGSNSLIKEESEGTIEFLYAQPISREKIVTIKLLSTFTMLLIFNIILFGITVAFFEAFKNPGYDYIYILISIYKGMFLCEIVFWAVGFVISTILSKVALATPAALGIFFTSYVIGIFSTLIDKLNWMKYLAPTQYVMPSDILRAKGTIDESFIIISIVIIVAGISFSFIRYKNKDFKI